MLIDEELGTPGVLSALETIKQRLPNAQFVITETVIGELGAAVAKNRPGAAGALSNFLMRGYTPVLPTPMKRGYITRTAKKIRDAGLLPREEKNDSLIIAECAWHGCAILLSSDRHCLNVHDDESSLWKILSEDHAETDNLIIAKPISIARRFG